MSHGGKGDAQRPTDKRAFDEGIDRIFGVKKPWYIKRDEVNNERDPEKAGEHRLQEAEQRAAADER